MWQVEEGKKNVDPVKALKRSVMSVSQSGEAGRSSRCSLYVTPAVGPF
jgi:hypothetical protein